MTWLASPFRRKEHPIKTELIGHRHFKYIETSSSKHNSLEILKNRVRQMSYRPNRAYSKKTSYNHDIYDLACPFRLKNLN